MTPSPAQPQPIPLDPITLGAMRCTTIDALPHHPQASAEEITRQRNAAFLIVAALRPRDPLEAMLAARVVAAHHHIMDNFRCAAQRDLPPNLQLRFQGGAVALSRTMDVTLHDLLDRQTAAPRRVEAVLAQEAPAPRAQPAPEAARPSAPPAVPAQTDTTQQAALAPRQPAHPAAPAPAAAPAIALGPRQPGATASPPSVGSSGSLDAATLEQLAAQAAARLAASSTAFAA